MFVFFICLLLFPYFLARRSNDVERAGSPEHLLGANFQVLLILDQERMAFLVHPVEAEGASLPPDWTGLEAPVPPIRVGLPAISWLLLSHL